jgi:pimeloyl-ACP methyl ester carboxylesterase/class 3 adenylate cyclase
MKPVTHYARSDGINIAYQVVGEGPRDLVLVPGWVSNVEIFWEEPTVVRFLERLASFSRLILFDKRGTGLSDRVSDLPPLETRMDDVRAVMDAVGSRRATLFGYSEGGAMCILAAATYPERVDGLIMVGSYPRMTSSSDYPSGVSPEQFAVMIERIGELWGGPVGLQMFMPSMVDDPRFSEWWARFLRLSASPGAAKALQVMNAEIDVRHVLPAIRVPTLVIHNAYDKTVSVEIGRYMAQRIPNVKYVELSGVDHEPFGSNADEILDEIEIFVTGSRHQPDVERTLATLMFTDIVDATRKATELGDRRWRDLLDAYYGLVREQLARFRGREVDTAGDGVLASFDGPARAIRAACAIRDRVRALGLEVRTGLHTGECEVMGSKFSGIALHIGARISALAGPGDVFVSSTVRDLVGGSGLAFREQGQHELKGVPGEWRVFGVVSS